MQNYYYDTNSYVWDSWSESDSRAWLIDHGVMKSDAQVQREKMAKLVRYVTRSLLELLTHFYQ